MIVASADDEVAAQIQRLLQPPEAGEHVVEFAVLRVQPDDVLEVFAQVGVECGVPAPGDNGDNRFGYGAVT